MRITQTTLRHLRVLRDHGPLLPGQFGQRIWPKLTDCPAGGNSSHRGGSRIAVMAGGRLGTLSKAGYVTQSRRGYELTLEGRQLLESGIPPQGGAKAPVRMSRSPATRRRATATKR